MNELRFKLIARLRPILFPKLFALLNDLVLHTRHLGLFTFYSLVPVICIPVISFIFMQLENVILADGAPQCSNLHKQRQDLS